MLPHRKKVDLATMTEEEKKLFRLYGKLPTHKNVLTKVQKDRKYFDSGDYALSKAGVAPQSNVGTAIPSPESIPHASPPSNLATSTSGTPVATPGIGGLGTSPVRESPLALDTAAHQHHDPAMEAASTSPTSSYPIGTNEITSSPLNPAVSGESSTTNESETVAPETATDANTEEGATTTTAVDIPHPTHPRTVDFTTVVHGMHKADLPNASTPASGALADTDMA